MDSISQFIEGAVVGDDYRIVRPLQEGGMGAVYVAEQLSTGKLRALKLMHARLVADTKSRQRFVEEARVGARIASEHIVEVVGAGIDAASGIPFLAMELLEGEDLASMVEEGGPIALELAAELMLQLGHALAAAHAQGIVHRDLKPENIFVATSQLRGAGRVVKVLDFGIAMTLAADRTAATATTAIGSPLFMAPEQATPGAPIRPATDVWAVGLIAFYVLTGRDYWLSAATEPFNLQSLLAEMLVHQLVPASQRAADLEVPPLPAGFDHWFARCVVRDAGARFPEAGDCIAQLAAILQPGDAMRLSHAQTMAAPSSPGSAPATALGHVSPGPSHEMGPSAVLSKAQHPSEAHFPSSQTPPPAPVAQPPWPETPAPLHPPSSPGLQTPPPTFRMGYETPHPPAWGSPTKPPATRPRVWPLIALGAAGLLLLAMCGVGYAILGDTPEPTTANPSPRSQRGTPQPSPPLPAAPAPSPDPRSVPVVRPTSPPPPPPSASDPPERGTLWVNTHPASTVFLDGRRVGTTPIRREVAAGAHQLILDCPRVDVREVSTITVLEGQATRIGRDFEEEARALGGAVSRPDPPGVTHHPHAPATPSRAHMVAAMRDVRRQVRACGGDPGSAVSVAVTFRGVDGAATRAEVTTRSVGQPRRSCVERAVMAARVPVFRQPSFTVNYPFRS